MAETPGDGGQEAEPDDDAFFDDMRNLGTAARDGDEDTAEEIADKYKK